MRRLAIGCAVLAVAGAVVAICTLPSAQGTVRQLTSAELQAATGGACSQCWTTGGLCRGVPDTEPPQDAYCAFVEPGTICGGYWPPASEHFKCDPSSNQEDWCETYIIMCAKGTVYVCDGDKHCYY